MRDYQTFNLDINKVKEQHVVRKDRMYINMGLSNFTFRYQLN